MKIAQYNFGKGVIFTTAIYEIMINNKKRLTFILKHDKMIYVREDKGHQQQNRER